jgi:hypothetical protein
MRHSLLVLALLAGCDREADQRIRCTQFIEPYAAGDHKSWIERCVTEHWSQKEMECHARTGGFQSMFCNE